MSADLLRRAAALMRERVEGVAAVTRVNDGQPWWTVSTLTFGHDGMFVEDAEHIASWHPAVALAVADWLDTFIEDEWPYCDCGDDGCLYGPCVAQRRAIAVARAYLGEDA